MDNIHRLQEIFSHFPGIGPRQAKRFVYYLMNKSPSFLNEYTRLITELKKSVFECERCHRFSIISNESIKSSLCSICSDNHRDTSILLVVARDADLEAIEASQAYNGTYFVLGGSVPVLDKEPERRIRLETLLKEISNRNNIKEIIVSMNSTPEGDHTAAIVRDAIMRIKKDTKISVLGRGISTGAELEYLDKETIGNALQNRH